MVLVQHSVIIFLSSHPDTVKTDNIKFTSNNRTPLLIHKAMSLVVRGGLSNGVLITLPLTVPLTLTLTLTLSRKPSST